MTKQSPMVVGLPPETKWRKPRLTIHVTRWMHDCYWTVNLDGKLIASGATLNNREPEARAAAQAYVDELLAHFRGGGE